MSSGLPNLQRLGDLLLPGGILEQRLRHRRYDVAGQHGVDADARRFGLGDHAAHQAVHGVLGRSVLGPSRTRDLADLSLISFDDYEWKRCNPGDLGPPAGHREGHDGLRHPDAAPRRRPVGTATGEHPLQAGLERLGRHDRGVRKLRATALRRHSSDVGGEADAKLQSILT